MGPMLMGGRRGIVVVPVIVCLALAPAWATLAVVAQPGAAQHQYGQDDQQ